MTANISVDGEHFIVKTEFFDNQRAKDLPDRKWDPAFKVWRAPINKTNAMYIDSAFRATEMEPDTITAMANALIFVPAVTVAMPQFTYKTAPMDHQSEALQRAWPYNEYAFFMDMGTGKTWTAINLAGMRYECKQINAMLVVCDTSVKSVWPVELDLHCGVDYAVHVHESGLNTKTSWFSKTPASEMKVLIIGVESLSQGAAWQLMDEFVTENEVMMVIDESVSIKTPPKVKGGKIVPNRTSRCWDAGEKSKFRIIMTGTPITQGVEDLFAQFRFLNWEILGNKNYFSFKARYCTMGGFQHKKIIGYQNMDELLNRVRDNQFSIKITDVMDMPPQVYEQKIVQPSDIQAKMLRDLGDPYDMSTSMGELTLDCETVLERMIRYQQIVGGHFPFELEEEHKYGIEVIPGKNPKMEELMHLLDVLDTDRKVVIWSRFIPERKLIMEYLNDRREIDGSTLLEFKGGMTTDERIATSKAFQTDPACRFMVSGGSGYKGVTWTAANVNIYFSNTFSYGDREQSERRTWRKGQDSSVLYIDITMNHKIDKQIIAALKAKQDLATYVDNELRNK